MVNLQEWEQQLQRRIAEIHHHGGQLATRAAAVRGRGEVNGIFVEVDATGDITNLQIAPGAMRWSSNQLTAALLECHRKARADAKAKTDRAIDEADPRIRTQLQQQRSPEAASPPGQAPFTENDIQAADDEYFERRNLYGGWTDRP